MRVFVTGATGQLGLPLVAALVAQGQQVVGLSRGNRQKELEAAGAVVLAGTLGKEESLREGIRGAEVIFHLAGGIRGPGVESADQLNRVGTETLIAAAKAENFKGPLIFASSCAVYGDRNGLWVTEDYAPAPHTLYGESKLAAEKALLESGLDVRIARIAAVYGPGIRFLMDDRMKAGRAFLPGEGLNYLPVVHIADCVGALLAIVERGSAGKIYNVAGRTQPQLKEFYKEVHKLAGGRPMRFWSTWIPSGIQFRAAEANEKLISRLGRKPRFTSDNLRLFTAGVRMKTDRLEKELGYNWVYPGFKEGIQASFRG
jgi:nucleoside-diphosphate-sugar epimerase